MVARIFSLKCIPLALILLFAGSACAVLNPTLKGAVYPANTQAADIHLSDQNGQSFQLSSYRGKIALVFFGFSSCTAECPATMAILRQALETANVTSQDVVVAMVSTDPEDDTPESMKSFMEKFNPAFLGLLGTPDELAKAWKNYGVVVQDGGETHSSFTYVVDKSGYLRETIAPDTSPDDVAADLKVLLAEK